MEEQGSREELRLLLPAPVTQPTCNSPRPNCNSDLNLDLGLSMSIGPGQPPSPPPPPNGSQKSNISNGNSNSSSNSSNNNEVIQGMQELKQQTAEQVRLAAAERAYAERVRY